MSTDGGGTWFDISKGADGQGIHLDHHASGFDANGKLLDGNDGGIWRLENSARDNILWTNLNANLNITQFIGIALHPTNPDIIYGGNQDNGTVKFTGGSTWRELRVGDGGFVHVDAANPNTVYHTYNYPFSGFLERSDDGGVTWTGKTTGINLSDPGNFYIPYVLDPAKSSRLLLGTNRVYETTNRADSWSAISTPNVNGWATTASIDSLAAAPTDVNTVYAAAGGNVLVTRNRSSWTLGRPIASGLSSVEFTDLAVDPTNPQIAYVVAANFNDITGGGHVWRTTNAGASWTNITGTLPDLPTWTIELKANGPGEADDVLYVGMDDGVYVSTNLGTTWTRFGTGLPRAQVRDLRLNTQLNVLAAGTHGRGTWEIFLG